MIPEVFLIDLFWFLVVGLIHLVTPARLRMWTGSMMLYVTAEMLLHNVMEDNVAWWLLYLGF